MLIGIFGDSYAAKNIMLQARDKLSWVDHLKNHSNLKITNFAQNGTGLSYSYKIFLKEHKNFEKIIFIASQHNRWHLPILEKIGSITWVTSLINYKHIISRFMKGDNRHINSKLKLTEKALTNWYRDLYVSQRSLIYDYLVYKKIKKLHSKTLYMRSFFTPEMDSENFIPKELKLRNKQALQRISELDMHYFKKIASKEFTDYRQNHMNQENNKIFANKINVWLHTGQINLNITDFAAPTEKEEDLWDIK